jgi:DNA repair protein RecO (recombination protein O)
VDTRTTGLILRTRRLTETSLIVHWLTADMGRLATVAKGALRPKSPLRGKLDLFYKAEFSFARSRRSELHALREVRLLETHALLRQELAWLQQASYCAAFIEQATETDTPLPMIYELMDGLLEHLPRQPAQPLTLFAFEMKMLVELGLGPDLDRASLSGGTREILKRLAVADWSRLPRLKLSAAQQTEIRRFLHGFLIYHVGKLPLGRSAAAGESTTDQAHLA